MKIKSNAKINVFLNVVGKNEVVNRGVLHEIESLIVPINIYDNIEIYENDIDEIIGMDIPIETNLMYKALCKVRNLFNIEKKVKIIIEKNIPIFAGLGGGSSNAAAVIKALNVIWNLNMSEQEMISIGKEIGSDIPFFIINKPSFVYGIGEKVELIDNYEKIKGILIFDNDKSSTKEVYDRVDEFPFSLSKLYNLKLEGYKSKNETYDYSLYNNDLEKGLNLKMYSKIQSIKNELIECGAIYSAMSGSGGSVFGIFKEENEIKECYEKVKQKYKYVYVFESK